MVLIIAAFALDYRTQGADSDADDCIAEVDGSCVPLSDYHTLLRLVAPPGATNKQLQQMGFVQHAVDALVERELLLQEAERLGVSVSEDDLDDALALGQVHFSWPADAPIPQALAAGQAFPKTGALPTLTYLRVRNSKTQAFDYDIYRRQVQNRLRMSPKHFKAQQEAEVVAARVKEMLTNPVRVSEDEVFQQFERERSNATARVVEAKQSWFRRFAVSPDPAAVQKFANEKQALVDDAWKQEEQSWAGACPIVSELLFRYPPDADEAAQAEAAARADEALALLKSGVDFAVVANMLSDADTASAGGALGCLSADAGPSGAELLAAVEKLAPGEMTGVLETPQGRHVFLFHGKLDKEAASKLGRQSVARRLYAEQRASELASAYAQELIAKAKAGGDLDTLSQELTAKAVKLPLEGEALNQFTTRALEDSEAPRMEVSRTFTLAGTPVFGVKGDADVAKDVFALAKADELLPKPVETFSGFAVVQLKEKNLATKEEFEKDKENLMRMAREMRRASVLTSHLERLKAETKSIKINKKQTGAAEAEDADAPMESSG